VWSSHSLLELLTFSTFFEEFSSTPDDFLRSDPFDFGCFNDDVRRFSAEPDALDEPAPCADVLDFGDVLLVVGSGLRDRDVRWLNFSKLDCLDDVGTCDWDAFAAFSAARAFLNYFEGIK
jgi:hypothetical protein